MKNLKYILLYTPIVLISTLGYWYYGIFSFEGLKAQSEAGIISQEGLNLFREIYRMANTGVAPLCFVWLVWLCVKHNYTKNISFRVQVFYMLVLFIVPKFLDHAVTVVKVYTENEQLFDAYTYSDASFWLLITYCIATPIRINYLKRKMRYDG